MRRLGISNYHLFWRRQVQTTGPDTVNQQFLPQFKGDPSAMRDLRALLEESSLGEPNVNLPDDDVLFGIGRLLESGELIVVRAFPAHGGNAAQPDRSSQQNAPATSPGPASGSNAPPPENPTFPSNTDGGAQASTLSAAAADGAPFCAH